MMRKSPFFVNVLLCILLGIFLLSAVIVRAFAPHIILPTLNVPALAAFSLAALLLGHCLAPEAPRRCSFGALYSALTFTLLPWASAYLPLGEALRTGVVGGIVFAVSSWLFAVIEQRLDDSDTAPAAPVLCAFGLYLAAQGFMGILL